MTRNVFNKCYHCNEKIYTVNTVAHVKEKHDIRKVNYYKIEHLHKLIDFLTTEYLIPNIPLIKKMILKAICSRHMLNIVCKNDKTCNVQVIIHVQSDGNYLTYYFGRHNHEPPKILTYNERLFEKRRIFLNVELHSESKILQTSDAKTTDIFVRKFMANNLANNHLCPVLVYKPQKGKIILGIPNDEIDAMENLFIIALQTNSQLELASNTSILPVCTLDLSMKSNIYNFPLITFQLLTENGCEIPIASFILSNLNQKIFSYLCQYVKPFISPCMKMILTNYDGNLVGLIEDNFEEVNCICCIFDLQQKIWLKLQELEDNIDYVNDMFSYITKYLISVYNARIFQQLCDIFINKFENTSPVFVKYFEQFYMKTFYYWTKRKRVFHNYSLDSNKNVTKIMDILMIKGNRRPVKRISDLMLILLSLDVNYFQEIKNKLPQKEIQNHSTAMKILTNDIRQISSQTYEVTCGCYKYKVFKKEKRCEFGDFCRGKCYAIECCNLCAHMYVCSCNDSSAMCPHIHKIHSTYNVTETRL